MIDRMRARFVGFLSKQDSFAVRAVYRPPPFFLFSRAYLVINKLLNQYNRVQFVDRSRYLIFLLNGSVGTVEASRTRPGFARRV